MWPASDWGSLRRWQWPAASRFAAQAGTQRSRGRCALHAGRRALRLAPRNVFLAPGYHCRRMLNAAIALSASFSFYRLISQLQPDREDVHPLLNSMPTATRGQSSHTILAAHFFGIEVPLVTAARFRCNSTAQIGHRGVAFARWLADGCDLHGVAKRRRFLYTQWLQAREPLQLRGLCQLGQALPAGRWDDTPMALVKRPAPGT